MSVHSGIVMVVMVMDADNGTNATITTICITEQKLQYITHTITFTTLTTALTTTTNMLRGVVCGVSLVYR